MNQFPKGATHIADDERFYMQQDDLWYFWSQLGAWRRHWSGKPDGAIPMFEKTPAWAGIGPPPVGSTVERRFLDHGEKWSEITVLCHGKNTIYYRDRNGTEWSHYLNDLEFRPIRTPQQTAAEEREVAVSEMLRTTKTPLPEATAYALYDAGYRK